jgi:hypothetical protein
MDLFRLIRTEIDLKRKSPFRLKMCTGNVPGRPNWTKTETSTDVWGRPFAEGVRGTNKIAEKNDCHLSSLDIVNELVIYLISLCLNPLTAMTPTIH